MVPSRSDISSIQVAKSKPNDLASAEKIYGIWFAATSMKVEFGSNVLPDQAILTVSNGDISRIVEYQKDYRYVIHNA